MKILLINHLESDYGLLESLTGSGYTVDETDDRKEAKRRILENDYKSLILLLKSGDLETIQYFSELREERLLPIDLTLFVLGSHEDDRFMVDAIQAGADEFISLPLRLPHLFSRLHSLHRKKRYFQHLRDQLEGFKEKTYLDDMTQIPNRRYLMKRLTEEVHRSRRHSHPISLLLFDLDNLKPFNDRLGHWAGDELLTQLVQRVKGSLRESDIFCRYGGDEFICILPETGSNGAKDTAEKIRSAVNSSPFFIQNDMHCQTVSVGATTYQPFEFNHPENLIPQLIQMADVALYRAKHHGRNSVCHLSFNQDLINTNP